MARPLDAQAVHTHGPFFVADRFGVYLEVVWGTVLPDCAHILASNLGKET